MRGETKPRTCLHDHAVRNHLIDADPDIGVPLDDARQLVLVNPPDPASEMSLSTVSDGLSASRAVKKMR